jgi:hypothetical protein
VKDALQAAEVWVRRSDWERVTESEELVGRFNLVSRLPQYLIAELVEGDLAKLEVTRR